jgi:hypothetical protein
MNKYLRNVIVMILALLVGVGLIMLIQGIGHKIYPSPEGLDLRDTLAIKAYMAEAPIMALLMVPISYLVGGLGAELIASIWTKGDKLAVIIVGGILLAATIYTLFLLPNPIWLAAVNVISSALPILVGLYLAPQFRAK